MGTSGSELSGVVVATIRAEMGRQRRTGAELAAVLGRSPQAVSRRLNGVTPLDLDELAAIAAWLDVDITHLLRPEQ